MRETFVLSNHEQLNKLKQVLDSLRSIRNRCIENMQAALETLDGQETFLTQSEIKTIYDVLNIHDSMTPKDMNDNLKSTQEIVVISRKYLHSQISRTKFRLLIEQLVTHFANFVSGNVLHAIIDFIDNFSFICATTDNLVQNYKELCFKFFTPNLDKTNLLVLVVNIDFKEQQKSTNCSFCCYETGTLNIDFFGAITRLSKNIFQEEQQEHKTQEQIIVF